MKICFATSECVPYLKTGGLADVSGALPRALAALGCEVKLFMPLYGSIHTEKEGLVPATELDTITVYMGNEEVAFRTWYGLLPDSNVEAYFIDCPQYYHRGQPYTSDPDEGQRFILLQHAVFKILQRYHWSPAIMHCNDWQTGLIPAMLRVRYGWDQLFRSTASVMTIHNIGYQGRFDPNLIPVAQLPPELYYPMGPFEFWDSFSFLKAGLSFAEVLTTVSERYAEEIQLPEFGEGMEGLLSARSDDLFGILNGIDTEIWNPSLDKEIAQTYTAKTLAKKQANKEALLTEFSLPYRADRPVIGIVSRLAGSQKGFDLLHAVMDDVMEEHDAQFIILGSGDAHIESFLEDIRNRYPERVGLFLGFNDALAHRIEGGADIFLMPSRYEPCGLNQMYSLNYGTVPIVRHTGGLADTVQDYTRSNGKGNGFSFESYDADAFKDAIDRALAVYTQPDEWKKLAKRGMKQDFSWAASAKRYIEVYEQAIERRLQAIA